MYYSETAENFTEYYVLVFQFSINLSSCQSSLIQTRILNFIVYTLLQVFNNHFDMNGRSPLTSNANNYSYHKSAYSKMIKNSNGTN